MRDTGDDVDLWRRWTVAHRSFQICYALSNRMAGALPRAAAGLSIEEKIQEVRSDSTEALWLFIRNRLFGAANIRASIPIGTEPAPP